MSSPRGPCSAPASMSSRTCCRASASTSTLVDGTDLDALAGGDAPEHQDRLPRIADQSDARGHRHRRRRRNRPCAWRDAGRRQCVRHAAAASIRSQLGADCVVYSATKHIDGQGRVLGGVILASEPSSPKYPQLSAPDRPGLSPFNAWVLLKSLETLPMRVAAQARSAGADRRLPRRASRGGARLLSRPRRPSAGRAGAAADVGRRHAARLRRRGRQAGRVPDGQRALDHRHLQQSGRRQEPAHPSGDDDPPAPEARAARRARDRPGPGPAVGRARGRRTI